MLKDGLEEGASASDRKAQGTQIDNARSYLLSSWILAQYVRNYPRPSTVIVSKPCMCWFERAQVYVRKIKHIHKIECICTYKVHNAIQILVHLHLRHRRVQ